MDWAKQEFASMKHTDWVDRLTVARYLGLWHMLEKRNFGEETNPSVLAMTYKH